MSIVGEGEESHNKLKPPPIPEGQVSGLAFREMLKSRSILSGLEVFHNHLGDVFQIKLPGFKPIFLAGSEASRFILVTHRDEMIWRVEPDPVVDLLGRGLLVEDGESHDRLRAVMTPAFHRRMLERYVGDMVYFTDSISDSWVHAGTYDLLVEMRKIALLVLVSTLFQVDMSSDLERMWPPILKTLNYISPGLWMLWRNIPRRNFRRSLQEMDDFLYGIIQNKKRVGIDSSDMLGMLLNVQDLDDKLIRDQMLTMLIAGHDTSTAMLAWAFYLLGIHGEIMQQVHDEIDIVLGDEIPTYENINKLDLLTKVIKETLRLYPPIHAGNRIVKSDLDFQGNSINAGSRVIYSIYLTHRNSNYWSDPLRFDPERFTLDKERERPAYSYLPFGGGPRNCIGAGFSQIEGKVILARLFQKYEFRLLKKHVISHMGATLEPRPGVLVKVFSRK